LGAIRTFVAIEIPKSIRQQITEFQAELKKESAQVSWVNADNIHLTLKFLGDVEADQMNRVRVAVQSGCQAVHPFSVKIEGAGCFPNRKNPRVLWIGIDGEMEALLLLQERVENELTKLGFPKEERKFSAHLTIGRVKGPSGIQPVIHKMENSTGRFGEFLVDHVNVMKSDLQPLGAVYSVLSSTKL